MKFKQIRNSQYGQRMLNMAIKVHIFNVLPLFPLHPPVLGHIDIFGLIRYFYCYYRF